MEQPTPEIPKGWKGGPIPPEKRKKGRAGRHEMMMRVNEIAMMIIDGHTTRSINSSKQKEWGLLPSTMCSYINKARQMLVEDLNIDRETYAAAKITQLEGIVKRGLDTNQLSSAVGALRLICEIAGLNRPSNMPPHR